MSENGILDLLEQRHGVHAADGLQILSAATLTARPFDPGMPLLMLPAPTPVPAREAVLPGRHGHGESPLDLLRRLYPAGHPVLGVETASDTTLERLDDDQLRSRSLLLPALTGVGSLTSPHALPWLVARLRAPDGCPWDREQDHLSLRPFLLEETYEVYDALEQGSTPRLAGELGDLLLQIVLHAQYGAEAGVFDMADIHAGIVSKIVRRHPHVFGDVEAATSRDVMRNWETIKAAERADDTGTANVDTAAADPAMPAAFAGLSRSLPALAYAQEMQDRAAGLGYDWPDVEGVIDKIAEEAEELLAAPDDAARREEFGDLLFVVVDLARKLGIDAEAALRAGSRKFAARFARVERMAREDGVMLQALSLEALDELWERAKAQEREGAAGGSSGYPSATAESGSVAVER